MLNNLPGSVVAGLYTLRDVLRFAGRRASEERIAQVASSLTFTTILSIVPLFTIVFGVLTALPIFSEMQMNLRDWLAQNLIPPAISDTIFRYLNQFAAKARGLTLIGVVFLIVTALSTVLTIDRALNTIWHVRRPRPLSRRVLVYWAVLTVGPILLAGSLTLTSYLTSLSGDWSTGLTRNPPFLLGALLGLLPIALMALAYAALYVYVPNRYVAWRDALIGGAFAALAFELTKRGFAAYLNNFRSFTAIYGALAALPIFLLWIYLSWLVTLLGASVAASLPMLYDRNWNRGVAPGQDYADALRILRALYRARVSPAGAVTGASISSSTGLPGLLAHEVRDQARMGWDEVAHFLERLEAMGLVIRSRPVVSKGATHIGHDDLWLFAADPHEVTVGRLFRQFAFDGKKVARVGLHMEDPLAENLRATRTVNADVSLAEAWGLSR